MSTACRGRDREGNALVLHQKGVLRDIGAVGAADAGVLVDENEALVVPWFAFAVNLHKLPEQSYGKGGRERSEAHSCDCNTHTPTFPRIDACARASSTHRVRVHDAEERRINVVIIDGVRAICDFLNDRV